MNSRIKSTLPNDDYAEKSSGMPGDATDRTKVIRPTLDMMHDNSRSTPGKITLPGDDTLRNSFGDGYLSHRLSALPTRDAKQKPSPARVDIKKKKLREPVQIPLPTLEGIKLDSPMKSPRRLKGRILVIGSEKVMRVGDGGLEVRRDVAEVVTRLNYPMVTMVLRPVEIYEGLEEVIGASLRLLGLALVRVACGDNLSLDGLAEQSATNVDVWGDEEVNLLLAGEAFPINNLFKTEPFRQRVRTKIQYMPLTAPPSNMDLLDILPLLPGHPSDVAKTR